MDDVPFRHGIRSYGTSFSRTFHSTWDSLGRQERILEHFGEESIKPVLEDLLYHAKDVRESRPVEVEAGRSSLNFYPSGLVWPHCRVSYGKSQGPVFNRGGQTSVRHFSSKFPHKMALVNIPVRFDCAGSHKT